MLSFMRAPTRVAVEGLARRFFGSGVPKIAGLHEPKYLDELRPKVGHYELLDLQLRGYDFVVLEKYQSYLHRTMTRLEFQVTDAWSVPCQELDLSTTSTASMQE